MIARYWRGWTTPDNAEIYERILREDIIPGIEARCIDGLLHIDVLRQNAPLADSGEIEFATIFWFETQDAIKAFVGEDVTRANMPDAARAVLSRWDQRTVHYEVRERRPQN